MLFNVKTIVGFLSRPHGLDILKNIVLSTDYKIIKLYTHSKKPKSEDPNQNERDDFKTFQKICLDNNIPLEMINSKNDEIQNCPQCDILIEVSWRYLLPKSIIQKAKILAFGIHRGKLPDYSGAEPIKQAIKNNETKIILSAHNLESIIDSGSTLNSLSFPIQYDETISVEENIQKIRENITPLFSKLFFNTLENQ